MSEIYDSWEGVLIGSTTVIEDDAKEYIVKYPRYYGDQEPFKLLFREKKRPIGFKEWK